MECGHDLSDAQRLGASDPGVTAARRQPGGCLLQHPRSSSSPQMAGARPCCRKRCGARTPRFTAFAGRIPGRGSPACFPSSRRGPAARWRSSTSPCLRPSWRTLKGDLMKHICDHIVIILCLGFATLTQQVHAQSGPATSRARRTPRYSRRHHASANLKPVKPCQPPLLVSYVERSPVHRRPKSPITPVFIGRSAASRNAGLPSRLTRRRGWRTSRTSGH